MYSFCVIFGSCCISVRNLVGLSSVAGSLASRNVGSPFHGQNGPLFSTFSTISISSYYYYYYTHYSVHMVISCAKVLCRMDKWTIHAWLKNLSWRFWIEILLQYLNTPLGLCDETKQLIPTVKVRDLLAHYSLSDGTGDKVLESTRARVQEPNLTRPGNPLSLVLSPKVSFRHQRKKYSARGFIWYNFISYWKPKITWNLYEPDNLALGKPEGKLKKGSFIYWSLYASLCWCLYETFEPFVSRQEV